MVAHLKQRDEIAFDPRKGPWSLAVDKLDKTLQRRRAGLSANPLNDPFERKCTLPAWQPNSRR